MRYWSSRLRETGESYAGRNGYRWVWCIMLIWKLMRRQKFTTPNMQVRDCSAKWKGTIAAYSFPSKLVITRPLPTYCESSLNWDLFGRVELHCFNPVVHRLNFSWASMLRAMTVITQIGHVHAVTWPHHKTSRIDVQSPRCLRLHVHILSYGGKVCAHHIKCSLVSRSRPNILTWGCSPASYYKARLRWEILEIWDRREGGSRTEYFPLTAPRQS
jgi:hypothetical protein